MAYTYTLFFPNGMVRTRAVVDGVSFKTYLLKDHNGDWKPVAHEIWEKARQQAAREKKAPNASA